MEHLPDYLGLCGAAFLSATIFPFQSEAILVGMLMAEYDRVGLLIAAASLGNIAGSCDNWYLGRFIARFEEQRWFPVSKAQASRAEELYRRYGRWSLLLSWMPVVGDPLTVVAGVLREPFPVFLALVSVAKTARYIAVATVTLGFVTA